MEKKPMYVRLAKSPNNYKMVPEDTDILQYAGSGQEYYVSIYKYNEEHYKHWKTTGSVAGIKDVITNKIVLDFDDKSGDLEKAKADALTAIGRIVSKGIPQENIQLSFSGSKGFHVEFKVKQTLTPDEFKRVTFNLCEDLATFDKVVNDPQRIFRIVGTKHPKSGLCKYPLTVEELRELTTDTIKELAKDITKFTVDPTKWNDPVALPEELLKVKETPFLKKETVEAGERLDLTNKPKWLSPAKYAIQEGFFESGERDRALLILAATYKNQGFSKEINTNMLRTVADLQAARYNVEPFSDKEIDRNIINQVYGSNWNGGQFPKDDPLLLTIMKRLNLKTEDDEKPVIFSDLGGSSFERYAKSFYETRIYTGLADLDEAFPMCAGSNIAIVGAASSGKTAISLNILKRMKDTNAVSVFASLDMARSRLYEKLLYNVTGGTKSREDLYKDYLNGKGDHYDRLVKEQFPNTYIYSKSSPSVTDLSNYIKKVEDYTGKPVRLLMVDYFERLGSEKSDDTAASKDVASGIQDLISDFPELTPITLYQPNKFSMGGGPDKPILNYTAIKGSSFIIQSARQILSLWRPFFNPEFKEYDKFMEMAILKNDLGELDKFVYKWKGKTGEISMMSEEDELEYKEYMKEKSDKESQGNGGF